MIRNLIHLGNPRLLQKSKRVDVFDNSLKKLVDDMFDTMYDAGGIGLAAVQMDVLKRVFVVDIPAVSKTPLVCVNPSIAVFSKDEVCTLEGCLSIPEINFEVKRSRSVLLNYYNLNGEEKEVLAEELFAVCIQHELDHLNGVLFLERTQKSLHKKIDIALMDKNYQPYFKK